MADDATREDVRILGNKIRDLKARLKDEGMKSPEINKHQAIIEMVAELAELKKGLAEGDSLTDEAFFIQQRKEREEREGQRKKQAEEEKRALQAAEKSMEMPLVQRKIFHLFCHAGNGPSFHYEPPPRFNTEQTGLGSGGQVSVFLTEKWDGTTMQATSRAVFRRLDLVTKRKGEVQDPGARYTLRLVAWREPSTGRWCGLDHLEADAYIAEALQPFLARFEAMPEDLCVYFECVHTFIQARYRHLEGLADIRVFDFSRCGAEGNWSSGQFLPFKETIELAERYQLPLVGWEQHEGASAQMLWQQLVMAKSKIYVGAQAPLEGYVVRESSGPGVAKARVEHILDGDVLDQQQAVKQIPGSAPDSGPQSGGKAVLDIAHIDYLGLDTCKGSGGELRMLLGR